MRAYVYVRPRISIFAQNLRIAWEYHDKRLEEWGRGENTIIYYKINFYSGL